MTDSFSETLAIPRELVRAHYAGPTLPAAPRASAVRGHSLVIRDMLYRNFQTSLRTRIQDGGGIVVATRWHTDDLAGRLLQNESGRWKVVSFPAIALENEKHRKQGEALSPEPYSLAAPD